MFDQKAVLPDGFSCLAKNCGIKTDGSADLAVFYADKPCAAAAVLSAVAPLRWISDPGQFIHLSGSP